MALWAFILSMTLQNGSPIGTALFPPPSHFEALSAVQAEVTGRAESGYFADLTVDLSTRRNYPIDIQLLRCEHTLERSIPGRFSTTIGRTGYDCVMDVFPVAEPGFRISGFFYHDGLMWRYYGALDDALVIDIDRFDDGIITSRQTPKPGAIRYRGQPFSLDSYTNPYLDILDD